MRFAGSSVRLDATSGLARGLHRIAKRSQMWMLVGADIHKSGLVGRLAVQGAVLAYSDVLSVFLDDDDDLARTMARLDRSLRRGERAMEWLDGVCAFIPGVGGRLLASQTLETQNHVTRSYPERLQR